MLLISVLRTGSLLRTRLHNQVMFIWSAAGLNNNSFLDSRSYPCFFPEKEEFFQTVLAQVTEEFTRWVTRTDWGCDLTKCKISTIHLTDYNIWKLQHYYIWYGGCTTIRSLSNPQPSAAETCVSPPQNKKIFCDIRPLTGIHSLLRIDILWG